MLLSIVKLPNFFLLICVFITTFLLSFLLMGCYDTGSAYSSIYMTKLQFNGTSRSDLVMNGTSIKPETLDNFAIRVGYLSFCVEYDDLACSTYNNIKKLEHYPIVNVTTATASTALDLVDLASKFNTICFPWVLIAAIILTLLLLGMSIYFVIPWLPGKLMGRKMACGLTLVSAVLWGFGAMLQHEATIASKYLIPSSSMDLISVKPGIRAEAMSWTSFSFMLVTLIGHSTMLYKEMKTVKPVEKPIENFKY